MNVIMLLLGLAILGLGCWAITRFIPMPPAFQTLILVVAIVMAVFIVLNAFGIRIPDYHLHPLR